MKRTTKYSVLLFVFLLLASCGGPDVLLTNIVHKDGSVTRKIVMTWDEPDFDLTESRVPVDSTWTIERSFTISEEQDTLYNLTAIKTFASAGEITDNYISYGGSNGGMKRWAEFDKKFRWFTTLYRFSENIGRAINGYPPEDFMNKEQLQLFYMPDKLAKDLTEGKDSLIYKPKFDTLETLTDNWLLRSLVRATFIEIDSLLAKYPESGLNSEDLWNNEEKLAALLEDNDIEKAVDSVFGHGVYERSELILGEVESILEESFDVAFTAASYLVQTQMPEELTLTNGYIDTDGNIVWAVNGNVFLSEDYSMWAESVETNWWAWVVSGVFLLFVIIGLIRRK